MDSNETDKMPKTIEIRVECSNDVVNSNGTNQIYDFYEDENLCEASTNNLNHLSNTSPDEFEYQRISTSYILDNRLPIQEQSDLCSTPPTNHHRPILLQSSSVVEVSKSNFSPLLHVQRGLDHCITAPVHRNLFLESQEIAFSRSMTERRCSPMPARKLDRLSEREKKELIVNLVKIQKDGTVEVDFTKDSPAASELLEYHPIDGIPRHIDFITTDYNKLIPKLKIAMLVVGTRGDVQPFLAVARRLQEYGHHVRLATHSNFRGFVKSAGVDFYPLGGDPRVLAGYMARNKGLIPSAPGEISTQRKQIKAIIESLLPACTEPDPVTGESFRAQAIIANPPAYGHAHVAEALGVPLHIFFTMPWTQDTGKNKLKLAPIAYFTTYHGSISHLPTGYMWSPHVVPKPNDWGPLVDVVGYCFLNLGSGYQPPEEFVQWLQKGSQPIYIGFGSMPLEDSNKTTSIILEALENTGQRGIIDRGWGELGTHTNIPDNVFLLVDCPHDWLFSKCSAVVHHGGAGTTATGLKAGCPTTIVPFFGDQFFWGERIYQKEVGPAPIPISQLSVESLSEAIRFMLQPEVKSRAMELSVCIRNEDGVGAAVDAFHCHLPPEVPLPTPPPSEIDDTPNPLQWLFIQIGRLCCLSCTS
ncbi:hypothetical protein OROHE_022431 [Orobanche hederae]